MQQCTTGDSSHCPVCGGEKKKKIVNLVGGEESYREYDASPAGISDVSL